MIAALLLALAAQTAAPPAAATTTTPTTSPTTTTTTTENPFATATAEELVLREQASVAALGTYRLRFTKDELVDGKMTGVQVTEVLVRQSPPAVVAEIVSGVSRGQRFLYNPAIRKDELRVVDAGLLGIIGGLWININSPLTRADTNHPVTNLGLGPILKHIKNDVDLAKAFGGHVRHDVGFDDHGAWCIRWTAPKDAKNLYCRESVLCTDPKTSLLTSAKIADERGVFEDLRFEVLAQNLVVAESAFTPEGAGL